MPFNGSGTFTVINTFVPNTTILSAAVNANYSDIATGLSDCLTRDGQAGMTAALGIASGTVNAPGLKFNSEGGTGLFLAGTGNPAISIASASAFGFQVPGTANGSGLIGLLGAILVPTGIIIDFAGSSAPTGWLLCFGQEVSQASYPHLFAVIGTNWGTASTATAFVIPDLRGRALYGKDDMGGTPANRITSAVSSVTGTSLGAAGGAQSSTLTTATQLPSHTHAISDPTHTHANSAASVSLAGAPGLQGGANFNLQGTTISNASTGITVVATGSSTAFSTLGPTAIVNKIIFVGSG